MPHNQSDPVARLRRLELAAAASADPQTREDARRLGLALAGLLPLEEALGTVGRWQDEHRLHQRDGEIRGAQFFTAGLGVMADAQQIATALGEVAEGVARPLDSEEACSTWARILRLNNGRPLSVHQVYNILRGQRCGRNL